MRAHAGEPAGDRSGPEVEEHEDDGECGATDSPTSSWSRAAAMSGAAVRLPYPPAAAQAASRVAPHGHEGIHAVELAQPGRDCGVANSPTISREAAVPAARGPLPPRTFHEHALSAMTNHHEFLEQRPGATE